MDTSTQAETAMKAVVYRQYGSPEVLSYTEVPKPIPKEDEILIKVWAVSLNSSDWEMLTAEQILSRIWGVFRPRFNILGSDISGIVEAVGEQVTQFQPGDEVFGDVFDTWGGLAEYVCAKESQPLLHKPQSLSFEQAASIPQAGVVALQGLLDRGPIIPGQTVLINGAGGGAGTFAIQIAKMYGAEVTAVDSGAKFELMRSLGADHVIDYHQEDFSKNGKQYDLILDVIGRRSLFRVKRALKHEGAYVMAGGTTGLIFQFGLLGPLVSRLSSKSLGLLIHQQNRADIQAMVDFFERGEVLPVIDRVVPLAEASEAFRALGHGEIHGKVVIKI